MKMYILVMDDLSIGHAMNSIAHACVACTLKYQHTDDFQKWLNSFKKVTCKVTHEQFQQAMKVESEYSVMTESTLDNRQTVIAFKPREHYHKMFKFLSLYN